MKKLFTFLLAGIMAFSMVGCGEIETIGGETAKDFSSSPEVNVEDTYYTKVLEDCPLILVEPTRNNTHILFKKDMLYNSRLLNKEKFEADSFAAKYGKMSYEEYTSVLNEKDFKPITDKDAYKANPDAYVVPESIQNRYNWEIKNSLYFTWDPQSYLNNLEEFDYFTPNGLAVIYYYLEEAVLHKHCSLSAFGGCLRFYLLLFFLPAVFLPLGFLLAILSLIIGIKYSWLISDRVYSLVFISTMSVYFLALLLYTPELSEYDIEEEGETFEIPMTYEEYMEDKEDYDSFVTTREDFQKQEKEYYERQEKVKDILTNQNNKK